MPMIVKTAKSDTNNSAVTNAIYETALSMGRAIAAAVGTELIEVSGSTITNYISYVPMSPLGYPGWCVVVKASNQRIHLYIHKTNIDNTPDLNDPNAIGDYFGGAEAVCDFDYKPETCVMIFDENRDTVLFDVHPGSTAHGTDLADNRSNRISFTFFFARDVNNEVLCGVGNGHIYLIRMLDKSMTTSGNYTTVRPPKDPDNMGTLHLTKMVNYLSPGCPEMKSAYASVIRPFEKIDGKMYVSILYAGGKYWGRAGFLDTWNSEASTDYPGYCCYYPIEPFVNY